MALTTDTASLFPVLMLTLVTLFSASVALSDAGAAHLRDRSRRRTAPRRMRLGGEPR